MPSPAAGQMNTSAALQHLQRQIDQLARRRTDSEAGALSVISVHDGSTGANVAYGAFADPAFMLGGVTLMADVAMPVASSLYFAMGSYSAAISSLYRIDGTTFGYGQITKVRDASGSVVSSPTPWSLGDWTWNAAYSGARWENYATPTADFSIGYGTSPNYIGVNLLLGGTYRIECAIYEP